MEESKTMIQHISTEESAQDLIEALVKQYRILMECTITDRLDPELIEALTQEGIIF